MFPFYVPDDWMHFHCWHHLKESCRWSVIITPTILILHANWLRSLWLCKRYDVFGCFGVCVCVLIILPRSCWIICINHTCCHYSQTVLDDRFHFTWPPQKPHATSCEFANEVSSETENGKESAKELRCDSCSFDAESIRVTQKKKHTHI